MTAGRQDADITPEGGRPPPAAAPAIEGAVAAPVSATVPVDHLVRDIRDGLAQITTRELELRRREQDFDRQFQDLKREARQAATAELEQARRRLAQQTAELNAQAVELSAQRVRLGELGEQLRAKQVELEQKRTDLALRVQQARQRAERLRAWEARQRELLEERATALAQQEAEARQRIQRAQQDVARQRRETDQRQAELEARAAALEQAEREVAERQTSLERRLKQGEALASEVEQHHGELSVARDWIEQERAELERAAAEVKVERARVAREWDQLEAASHELVAERKRLSERHAQLEQACAAFDAERRQLTEDRQQVEQARRSLETERTALTRRRAELDERHSTLEIERVELGQHRRRIEQVSQELKAAQEAVRHKHVELEAHSQGSRHQDHRAQRQMQEVEAARRTLQQEQAAFEERSQRQARRETQLRDQLAKLEAKTQHLKEWEAELETRRTTLAEAVEQAQRIQAEAHRQRNEALALREQLERRAREAHQSALALESERRRRGAAHAASEADLDRRRAALEQERTTLQAERTCRTERSAAGPDDGRRVPRRWRGRTAALAVTAGCLAAGAWIALHPPLHRASIVLRVATSDPARSEALFRHRTLLLDADLLAGAPSGIDAAWRQACAQNRVTVVAGRDEPTLQLSVNSSRAAGARQLLQAAADAYAHRVENGAAATEPPAAQADLISRRAVLAAALRELRQKQAADETEAAIAADDNAREEARAVADRLEAELAEVTKALEQQRGELAALMAAEVPRGTVSPAEVDRALAEDTIYREDREESRAAALQYRTELAVAMFQLVDPAKTVGQTLAKLTGVLQEQRGLDPPAEIRAVLEACAADLAHTQAQHAAFLGQWHAWLETVRSLDIREDVAGLVNQQSAVADAARRQADALVALVDNVGARIDGLDSAGTGGTREVVVAAVLRSEHGALATVGEAFQAAAARISPTDNLELNAQDRKLRGLRMRVAQRREAVTQQLQLSADLAARDAHAAAVEQLRTGVRALERRREDAVTGLMGTLRTLRDLDGAHRRRGERAVQTQQRAAEIAWLERRHADLDAELNGLLQRQMQPDRVDAGEITVERVAPRPLGAAALAGVAAFGATWLIGFVLVNPSRK